MKARKTTLKRETKETNVTVNLNLDGTGKTSINTLSFSIRPVSENFEVIS